MTDSLPLTIAATPFAPCGSLSSGAGGFAFVPRLTCSAPAAAREPAAITSRTTTAAKARTAARSPRRGAATGWTARNARCRAFSPAPGSGSGAAASIPSSRRSSSLDMLDLLQRLAQLLERASEARVDGPDRKIERFGDLLQRHADSVAQDDDDAPLEGEIGHRGEKAPVSRGMGRRRVGRVGQLLVGETALC